MAMLIAFLSLCVCIISGIISLIFIIKKNKKFLIFIAISAIAFCSLIISAMLMPTETIRKNELQTNITQVQVKEQVTNEIKPTNQNPKVNQISKEEIQSLQSSLLMQYANLESFYLSSVNIKKNNLDWDINQWNRWSMKWNEDLDIIQDKIISKSIDCNKNANNEICRLKTVVEDLRNLHNAYGANLTDINLNEQANNARKRIHKNLPEAGKIFNN